MAVGGAVEGSAPLAAVVAAGDRRASLEAVRDRLALEIECVEGRFVAPLAKQLVDVLREIDELPAVKGRSSFDDLAARRRDRGAASSG